jgi:hypothetical protein
MTIDPTSGCVIIAMWRFFVGGGALNTNSQCLRVLLRTSFALICSGVVVLIPCKASALVMNFNSLVIGSAGDSAAFISPTTHTEDGLTMTATGSPPGTHFDIGFGSGLGGAFGNNVGIIHQGNGGEAANFTYVGGAFNLLSIDATGWLIVSPDSSLTATFKSSSGASHDVSFNSTGPINFSSMIGWSNITSFSISVPLTPGRFCPPTADNPCSNFGFDNIVFEAAASPATVPLPGALPLMATGLGALGVLGWRRKRKAQAAA